jgi:hypothetical protein
LRSFSIQAADQRGSDTRSAEVIAMHDNLTRAPSGASYDSSGPALVIHDLTVNNPAVSSEAARWSTGQRGPAVGAGDLTDIDLSIFVTQAIAVGAQAIAAAGGVQDTYRGSAFHLRHARMLEGSGWIQGCQVVERRALARSYEPSEP